MLARRLLLLSFALAALGGCATKRDLRDLRTEVQANRTAQEALLQEIRLEIRRQNELILDSLTIQDVRLRGDLSNRMVQLERQLIQIQELTGQGQQRLEQLRDDLRAQEEALRTATARANSPAAPPAGDPAELFDAARGMMERGSYATARAGFEEFVQSFPDHERAPEAQLLIGESHERDEDQEPALQAYQRVVELHPSSTQAPTALFRAAVIEADRGNPGRARTMLNQLITAYPRSPEVDEAREALRELD